uniref:Uncharacterized protein n=1 Tax=Anguilla anguilla TaxID=7936 RepID=A0A0E9WW51_ANGAN
MTPVNLSGAHQTVGGVPPQNQIQVLAQQKSLPPPLRRFTRSRMSESNLSNYLSC